MNKKSLSASAARETSMAAAVATTTTTTRPTKPTTSTSSMSAINVVVFHIDDEEEVSSNPRTPLTPPSKTTKTILPLKTPPIIMTSLFKSKSKPNVLWPPDYIYGNSEKPSFTVGPCPATPTTTNDSTTSPTRLKIPFKLKNSASRAGSFKAKRKTKRSKSAPINQRRILVNSTFYTLLSTNYGDTLLSPGAGGGQLSPTSAGAGGGAGHHPNQPMCVFCEQKRYSQVQCHIFT